MPRLPRHRFGPFGTYERWPAQTHHSDEKQTKKRSAVNNRRKQKPSHVKHHLAQRNLILTPESDSFFGIMDRNRTSHPAFLRLRLALFLSKIPLWDSCPTCRSSSSWQFDWGNTRALDSLVFCHALPTRLLSVCVEDPKGEVVQGRRYKGALGNLREYNGIMGITRLPSPFGPPPVRTRRGTFLIILPSSSDATWPKLSATLCADGTLDLPAASRCSVLRILSAPPGTGVSRSSVRNLATQSWQRTVWIRIEGFA